VVHPEQSHDRGEGAWFQAGGIGSQWRSRECGGRAGGILAAPV